MLIARDASGIEDLPPGAVVATSSLRRRAQLLRHRPDLVLTDVRGNVDTRLRKMREGMFDAMIMALAGIRRLEREEEITEIIPYDILIPAVGQGSVAIEVREDDEVIRPMVEELADTSTMTAVRAERALMRRLEGGCQIPVGALGHVDDGTLTVIGMVASLDGDQFIKLETSGAVGDPETVGVRLAEMLLDAGGDVILAEIRSTVGEGVDG